MAQPARGLSLVEPEDREAVLQQWERKIEQEERRGRRFERGEPAGSAEPAGAVEPAAPGGAVEPAAPAPLAAAPPSPVEHPLAEAVVARFERPAPAPPEPVAERRTITITGQPGGRRRRATLAERHIAAQPDRVALWAFLMGLFLIAVAAGTAHA